MNCDELARLHAEDAIPFYFTTVTFDQMKQSNVIDYIQDDIIDNINITL